MYLHHTKCRACDSGARELSACKDGPPEVDLIPVFDLGLQPLANDFRAPFEEQAGYAPLKVMYCPRCTLSQLSVTVKPEILYHDYPYVTSKSETMKAHFALLWQAINIECTPKVVVEIGSNDGDFLEYCKDNGAQHVVGIDPATNLADVAKAKGIGTIRAVFDYEIAGMAAMAVPPVNAIVARHVFCHADNWWMFVKGVERMSNKDTVVFIEVPYVLDMLRNGEFDTIYHEHLSYLSIRSMIALLDGTPFMLCSVTRFPIHGGAIVMVIRRRDSGAVVDESVDRFVAGESNLLVEWANFKDTSEVMTERLFAIVSGLISDGASIAGFGASAKSTVWINACGFTKDHIRYICDCTPSKQHKLSPGTNIPIVDESRLLIDQPSHAIVFAWNFAPEILEKQIEYRNRGGKFIIPVPKLEIV